jgi:hypothetical protein
MPTKLVPASDDDIRALAHKMWEEEGRPEGQAEIHWQRAYMALAKPAKPAKAPAKTATKKAASPTKSSKAKPA